MPWQPRGSHVEDPQTTGAKVGNVWNGEVAFNLVNTGLKKNWQRKNLYVYVFFATHIYYLYISIHIIG